MSMYNKLFTKILDSSIWLESMPTRIVWLTIIAAMDEHGFAQFASVANIAHRARVSLEEAEAAMACLEGPDLNSSDPDNDGRRVERVPGGWLVLNAEKHRLMVTKAVIQEQTRERVRRHRAKKGVDCNAPVTQANDPVTPSEAVSVSEAVVQQQPHARTPAPTVTAPRRMTGGGAGAGTYPRDHLTHGFCGRFCVTAENFAKMVHRYGDGGDAAVTGFLQRLSDSLRPDQSPGGPLWVLQHFDAWLVEAGRVPAVPTPAKPGQQTAEERKAAMVARADAYIARIDAQKAARR